MHLMRIRKLRKSNGTHTYYSFRRVYPGPRKKIGTVTIDRVGNRTVAPYPGLTEMEIRLMRGFEPWT